MKKQLLELRKQMSKVLFNLSEQTADDGTVIVFDGDQIVEGAQVQTYDADGNTIPLNDGSYTLEDGTVIEVSGGKVTTLDETNVDMSKKKKKDSPIDGEDMAGVALEDTPLAPPAPATPEDGKAADDTMDKKLMDIIQKLIAKIGDLQKQIDGSNTKMSAIETKLAAEPIKKTVNLAEQQIQENLTRAERILGAK